MKRGFTLIETLIYAALASIVIGLFASILVTVTRIQGQQGASGALTAEINFLVSAIKGRINDATSFTIMDAGKTLMLGTNSYPTASTTIRYDEGEQEIILTENTLVETLSSERILVTNLLFTELSNEASRAIQIEMIVENNSANAQKRSSREIKATAIPLLQAQ